MRPSLCRFALVAGLFSDGATAYADALPAAQRALVRSDLAARDAPACEFLYGPRASLALAGEAGLWHWRSGWRDWRWSAFGQLALDNATATGPVPSELLRSTFGTTMAVAWQFAGWNPTTLELSAGLFRTTATTLGACRSIPTRS